MITPEIVGTIKADPEDFCVQEIASDKLNLPAERIIADLQHELDQCLTPKHQIGSILVSSDRVEEEVVISDVLDLEKDLHPLDVVRRVLQSQHVNRWQEELSELHALSEKACLGLQTFTTIEDVVWIPPISSESSCLITVAQRSGDRGSFHRCLKLAFPLLQSETIKREDGDPLICVSVDTSFLALGPHVQDPIIDTIQALYEFHKRGPPEVITKAQHCKYNRKRDFNTLMEDNPFCFILPLRPGLSKDDRRKIHHLISARTRDFETSTISDYKLIDGIQVSALVLKWSKAALRAKSSLKCRRSDPRYSLFVLKKRQVEHLTAVNTLTRILRCRQSDLGTAGIKDMHAVTYQFCTIRGVELDRLWKANKDLSRHGMEIGSISTTDHFLQPGHLQGNRFAVTVRDVKRIQVNLTDGHACEEQRPCLDREYILERADALRKHGFINFFGEQRLGTPGDSYAVGVRSFDIGRAMLQGDFEKAVDLLMTGRRICRGSNVQEDESIRKCRQVWRESGGNAEQTYKALPKGDSMARERTVLQGLKRYRNPLDAIKCLHFRERTFWIHSYQSYIWNKMASARLQMYGNKVVVGDLMINDDGSISEVSDDIIASVRLDQIVLPLPGFNVQYPANGVRECYIKVLEQENVTFEQHGTLEMTAKGTYRRLVATVNSLKLDFPSPVTAGSTSFQISFDLPPGSYATMLLRELMFTTVART